MTIRNPAVNGLQPCYKSAAFYDLLNKRKDYDAEVKILEKVIEKHKQSPGKRLLDLACGTGEHIKYLASTMTCEGLDLDPSFVEIAREKLPELVFHEGDMTSFKLPGKYDVITVLFSSIGYVKTRDVLLATIKNIFEHLEPGGLLIIEPWYTPETFLLGHSTVVNEETDSVKIVRMNLWLEKDGVSQGHSQMLVMHSAGIEHIVELHELALFTDEEYKQAMEAAGLEVVEHDQYGLIGRGLFVGRKP